MEPESELPLAKAAMALELAFHRRDFQLRTRDALRKAEDLATELKDAIGEVSVEDAYRAWAREVRLFIEEGR